MFYRVVVAILLLTTQTTFAKESKAAAPLENLNYKFVKTLYPKDNEPSKVYTLSFPSNIAPTSGIVIIKNMGGKFTDIPVFIRNDGTLSNDKINEAAFGFDGGYGEKYEVLLVATNTDGDKPIAKCEIIPFPRIIKDEKGRKIELKVASGDGHYFTINGSGFVPKEKIIIKSSSGNELGTFPLDVDSQGSFSFEYAPAVIGKKEGPFELTFSGENMKPLKMRHYWGRPAFFRPNDYKQLRNKFAKESKDSKK